MLRAAPNINYLFAGLLIEELVRHGVEWFVISPGSRSAPLAWTAASHPRVKTVVHYDERGAAFHALGIAKATLKPAAFICTSGTAAANALPAAVEASYSGIPLVLLTADRPERLQGSGANQTINQHGLYREFVRDERNFAVSAENFDAAAILTAIDESVHRATEAWPGPIHLNCQFDEPLTPGTAATGVKDSQWKSLSAWTESDSTFTKRPATQYEFDEVALSRLREIVARPEPGLIVVGQLSGPAERDDVHACLEQMRWPFIPDITSGLRLGPPLPWSMWDANLRADEIFRHPRTIIHIGGPVTSRRILEPLSKFNTADSNDREFVRISPNPAHLDPYGNVTLRIVAAPTVLSQVSETAESANQLSRWPGNMDICGGDALDVMLKTCAPMDPVTELSAVISLTGAGAPKRLQLFAGNSMPIRDLDTYGLPNLNHPTWVWANRGASGIDGNIATAAGIVRATGEPLIAILGDLAVLHDLNSLALLRDLPVPVVLIVFNNNGGGIFHFLAIAGHHEHFEKLMGAPHGLRFADAAAMFGLDYHRADTNLDASVRPEVAIEEGRSCIIEVASDRIRNLNEHRELDASIRKALGSEGVTA